MIGTYDTATSSAGEERLRARAEYTEMPGLRLTVAQAARLFNMDRDACAAVLDRLVSEGFLHRTGENYARANTGRRSM